MHSPDISWLFRRGEGDSFAAPRFIAERFGPMVADERQAQFFGSPGIISSREFSLASQSRAFDSER